MNIDITVKIGGEAGQGIQTVGDLLAIVCQKAGLYLMGINDYESRVRGGHNFFALRITDKPVNAPYHQVHVLIALDGKTLKLHQNELCDGGIVLMEDNPDSETSSVLHIPFTELAKNAGGKITSNTVAAGACLCLLGAPFQFYQQVISEYFGSKGTDAVEKNLAAASLGYDAVKGISFKWAFEWKTDKPKGAIIDGAKAFALGALAADCRMAAFYPMSPATAVMSHLNMFSDNFPVVVEQVEDEIAAINMVTGASFAGVRAMTSTSGGGFCLMTEGLGLAAMTETPVVIINGQRPGPATGLATRTAQSDLLFTIYASHDEFPRFVFAPGSANEAYETMLWAFHLSDKYQVPAIILSDHYFMSSIFLSNPLKMPQKIERFIVTDADIENPAEYKRFAFTPDGVSPRALPCAGKSLVAVTGNEHKEDGHSTESIFYRIGMNDKRSAKLPNMLKEMNPPKAYYGNSKFLLVGWGSSEGAIMEAVDILRNNGADVGCLIFTDLFPFPADAVTNALKNAEKFFMVEGNSTVQLGQLIRAQTGLLYAGTILKYDGRPFYPIDIVNKLTPQTPSL